MVRYASRGILVNDTIVNERMGSWIFSLSITRGGSHEAIANFWRLGQGRGLVVVTMTESELIVVGRSVSPP